MSCNCNCKENNCGLPNQPNYNNLNKGFIVPKKDCCCDCVDEDKICRNGKIVIIDKNHLYPHEGIYLEDKPDGNQILHITLRPNDYTYIVNFKNNYNFYVTHIFITYKEDDSNNCNNIYKLYINNQKECNPIEIRIDDNLKQFNNFYVRELDAYINEPDKFKYLKGKFFKLRSMRNLEIEVSKPMNSIRMYCDDNILKNNIRSIINNYIGYKYDEEGNSIYPTIDAYPNTFNFIRFDEYVDELEIFLTDIQGVCDSYNYEYKLYIVCEYDGISIIFDQSIYWANGEAPDFESGYDYEISISQNAAGYWCGVWTKYSY
jgi:hypothetical protein